MTVHVYVCDPGGVCLGVRCRLRARYTVQRGTVAPLTYCSGHLVARVGFYRGQGREITYSDAARRLLAGEGVRVP